MDREILEERVEEITHLLLISHGSLAPDHHLAARLLLQLLSRQASGAKNTPNKVKLK